MELKFLNFCDFRWRRRPAMRATRSSQMLQMVSGQRSQQQPHAAMHYYWDWAGHMQQQQASGGGRGASSAAAAAQRQAISWTSAATLALHTPLNRRSSTLYLLGPVLNPGLVSTG
jgi:hypothetical protein